MEVAHPASLNFVQFLNTFSEVHWGGLKSDIAGFEFRFRIDAEAVRIPDKAGIDSFKFLVQLVELNVGKQRTYGTTLRHAFTTLDELAVYPTVALLL